MNSQDSCWSWKVEFKVYSRRKITKGVFKEFANKKRQHANIFCSSSARSTSFSALSRRREQSSKRHFLFSFRVNISSLTDLFASSFSFIFSSPCCLLCSARNCEDAFFAGFLSSWSILALRTPPQH